MSTSRISTPCQKFWLHRNRSTKLLHALRLFTQRQLSSKEGPVQTYHTATSASGLAGTCKTRAMSSHARRVLPSKPPVQLSLQHQLHLCMANMSATIAVPDIRSSEVSEDAADGDPENESQPDHMEMKQLQGGRGRRYQDTCWRLQ